MFNVVQCRSIIDMCEQCELRDSSGAVRIVGDIVPYNYGGQCCHRLCWDTKAFAKRPPSLDELKRDVNLQVIIDDYWDEDLFTTYIRLLESIEDSGFQNVTVLILCEGKLPEDFAKFTKEESR